MLPVPTLPTRRPRTGVRLILFRSGRRSLSTFETDALRITLPFGTLLRSAAGGARCWPLTALVVIPSCSLPCQTQTRDKCGIVTVPKWACCTLSDR